MAKDGILHDYDLLVNAEPSAQKGDTPCAVCDASPVTWQWADLRGQAMCTRCGCPYQLKWGTKEQEQEGTYPHLSLAPNFVTICREYWQATHRWTYLGCGIGSKPGLREFYAWLREHHPELYPKE